MINRIYAWSTRNSTAIAVILVYKLLIAAVVVVAAVQFPAGYSFDNYAGNFHWAENQSQHWSFVLNTWDSQHYVMLSQAGYSDEVSMSHAFPPLWPALIGVVSSLSGLSGLTSGLLLSNLLSFAALLAFYRLAVAVQGESTARYSLLFLLAYPGSLFLNFAFSESLFLLLVVSVALLLHQQRFAAAALVSVTLPVVRVVGVFVALPLLVEHWRRWRSPLVWLLCAMPLFGYAVYLLWMYLETGDALIGMKAQALYHSQATVWKIIDIPGFIKHFFAPEMGLVGHGYTNSIIDRLFFVCLLLALPGIWRANKTAFAYTIALGVLPALASSLAAYTRYLLVVFPFFMALGAKFARETHWVVGGCLVGLAYIQFKMLWAHTHFYWAG